MWVYFWLLYSVSLMYVSIPSSISHSVNYCSHVISHEIRQTDPSHSLFFKCFSYSSSFAFLYISQNILSMSTKILSGILIRFTINLFISLGKIAVFIMLSLLINRQYVYLSRSSCFHQHFVMFSQCHIHILLDLYLSFPKLLQMVRFSSADHVQLCDPMDCSTPGLPVHHQLLEFTQTHVH